MYLTGVKSDHSAYFIGFEIQHIQRGRGFWKLNTSLLADPQFISKTNEYIEELKKNYAHLNPADKWELMKKQLRTMIQKYSKKEASDDRMAISSLSEKITEMEDNIHCLSEAELRILETSKIELEEKLFKRTKGVMFRSKAKWSIEAEHNTKYFYNLEKK